MNYAVIIAGGRGERFWPKSRVSFPKQLLPLVNKKSLLENTFERITPLIPQKQIYISTNQNLQKNIKKIIKSNLNFIIEPLSQNTAAAIGLAATYIIKKDPKAVMIILTADHHIKNELKFRDIIKKSLSIAEKDKVLITIGITPNRPETGYGYIEAGQKCANGLYPVLKFEEKPSLDKAQKMIKSGDFFWNSGIFIWSCESILEEIKTYLPNLYTGLMKIAKYIGTSKEEKIKKEVFESLESISIDYGIMEKSKKVFMIKSSFSWDDLGSWISLERIYKKNKDENIIVGEHIAYDTKNTIIYNDNENSIVTTLGVSNLIIISTKNAVLILDKNRHQEVKKIVEEMKKKNNLKKYL
ncbi:MAG: mannose-1-phosphate guanylyltransferase [bacterium]